MATRRVFSGRSVEGEKYWIELETEIDGDFTIEMSDHGGLSFKPEQAQFIINWLRHHALGEDAMSEDAIPLFKDS